MEDTVLIRLPDIEPDSAVIVTGQERFGNLVDLPASNKSDTVDSQDLNQLLKDLDRQLATIPGATQEPVTAKILTENLPQANSWWTGFINRKIEESVSNAVRSLSQTDPASPPVTGKFDIDLSMAVQRRLQEMKLQTEQSLASSESAEMVCQKRLTVISGQPILKALSGMLIMERDCRKANVLNLSRIVLARVNQDAITVRALNSCIQYQAKSFEASSKTLETETNVQIQELKRLQGPGRFLPSAIHREFMEIKSALSVISSSTSVLCGNDGNIQAIDDLQQGLQEDKFMLDQIRSSLDLCDRLCLCLESLAPTSSSSSGTFSTGPSIKILENQARALISRMRTREKDLQNVQNLSQQLEDRRLQMWAQSNAQSNVQSNVQGIAESTTTDETVRLLDEEQLVLSRRTDDLTKEISSLQTEGHETLRQLAAANARTRNSKGKELCYRITQLRKRLELVLSKAIRSSTEEEQRMMTWYRKEAVILDEAERVRNEIIQTRTSNIYALGTLALENVQNNSRNQEIQYIESGQECQKGLYSTTVGREEYMARLSTMDPAGYVCVRTLAERLDALILHFTETQNLLDLQQVLEIASKI